MDASPVCVMTASQDSALCYPCCLYFGSMQYVFTQPDMSLPFGYYPEPVAINLPPPHATAVAESSNGCYLMPMQEDEALPYDERFIQPLIPTAPFSQFPTIQQFQYFVVVDFEATCDADRPPYPQEIIEFPSVLVNATTGQVESQFRTYVRPKYNPRLSEFCKALTGIQQADVDGGVTLQQAIEMHDQWLERLGVKNASFAVVSWGDWDCQFMLEKECRFNGVQKPEYFDRWINLQAVFSQVTGRNWKTGLRNAVVEVGLTWEGRQHCGLDDAWNTSRLLVSLMACGFSFSITSTLRHEDGNGTSNPAAGSLQGQLVNAGH